MSENENQNDHVTELVDALLHGALDEQESGRVGQHCESCPDCRVALEEAGERIKVFRSLPAAEASADLLEKTEQRIERAAIRELAQASRGGRHQELHRSTRQAQTQQKTQAQKDPDQRKNRTLKRFSLTLLCLFLLGAVTLGGMHQYYVHLKSSPWVIQILGQTQWLPGTDASVRIIVLNRETGEPRPDIPVSIWVSGRRESSGSPDHTFVTDSRGTGEPVIPVPDGRRDLYLRVSADLPNGTQSVERLIQVRSASRLLVTTEKPVYQPGQTIHLRSLTVGRPGMKPVRRKEVRIAITDPRGTTIFQHTGRSSQFGITSCDCPLAEELIEGTYRIKCEIEGQSTTRTVKIRHYTLPKFRLDVDLAHRAFAPGECVSGDLTARYFFGRPVVDGSVSVKILDQEGTPLAGPMASSRTDSSGQTRFSFTAPADGEPKEGDLPITIRLELIDPAGQQEQKDIPALVTRVPIRVEAVPEFGQLVLGVPGTIFLFATYADGRPADDVRIQIPELHFDDYADPHGLAECRITPERTSLPLTIRLRDSHGVQSTQNLTLDCNQRPDAYVLTTDRSVYNGGDRLRLTAFGNGTTPVYVDVMQDGQTYLTTAIAIEDGRGDEYIDLPPELSGTVELCAYRMGESELPNRKVRVIHVDRPGDLRIDVESDEGEYRPGDLATLKIRTRGRDGRPVSGAVTLAAVDEAVFSVLGQTSSAYLPATVNESLLAPVLSSGWSPGLASTDRRLERALFERAVQEVSPDRDPSTVDLETLKPFLDGSLGVIDDIREFERAGNLNIDDLPPEIRLLLQGGDGHHSLQARSLPPDYREVEYRRAAGLRQMGGLWIGLIVLTVLVGVFGLLWIISGSFGRSVLVLGVFFFVLLPMMLPAVQQAREAARRSQAKNSVKQLEIGLENFREANGGRFPMAGGVESSEVSIRTRSWFPETLLWRPEVITDANGNAEISVPLADSITNWKVTASGISGAGELGSTESTLRVFQPLFVDLNLPLALTRGDEISLPVVVYNYSEETVPITLQIDNAEWFELLGKPEQTVSLKAGDVKSVYFPIRAATAGTHEVKVSARSSAGNDSVERSLKVLPGGRRIEKTVNGELVATTSVEFDASERSIDGSLQGHVKLYPSTISETVDGLESLFQMPHGCFEQTSSTTYPNVLALQYLQSHRIADNSHVTIRAQEFIHKGYQRLLTFEIDGGGFDWFGKPPANRTLTAYGLMEFQDMAKVHAVDPDLIERTRTWLLKQRNPDGSWDPDRSLHDDPTWSGNPEVSRLRTTAYIAWAMFSEWESTESAVTVSWLKTQAARHATDAYDLALTCNALLAMKATSAVRPLLAQLAQLSQEDSEGRIWWEAAPSRRTMFYGRGRTGQVETTALAALAVSSGSQQMIGPAAERVARRLPEVVSWLIRQKTDRGGWGSTQATVLALKALLRVGASRNLDIPREVDVDLNGETVGTIRLSQRESATVGRFDVSPHLKVGANRLTLRPARSKAAPAFQVHLRCHVKDSESQKAKAPDRDPGSLSVQLDWSRNRVELQQTVTATATVRNKGGSAIPMAMLEVPVPAGFLVDRTGFDRMLGAGRIARYDATPATVVLYLRSLPPGESLRFDYHLRASIPVRTSVRPAEAWEYYSPENRARSESSILSIPGPHLGEDGSDSRPSRS